MNPKTKTISCHDSYSSRLDPGSVPTEFAVSILVNDQKHFIKLYTKNSGWTPTPNGNVHIYVSNFLDGSSDLLVWGNN